MGLLPNLCQSINLSITISYLPFCLSLSAICHSIGYFLSIAISYLPFYLLPSAICMLIKLESCQRWVIPPLAPSTFFSATAAALISIAQNKMTLADSKHDCDVQDCPRGGTLTQTPQKTPVPTTLNPSSAFLDRLHELNPVPVSSVGLLGNNPLRRHKRGREPSLRKAILKKGLV